MNRSFLIFAVAFVALMAGALLYAVRIPVEQGPEPVAAPPQPEVVEFPEFTLNDIDGNPREFSEWHGRPRLLNFWATWCAPCRREIPLLKTFQDEQPEDGILIMGIAVDFPEEVARYAEAAEFNYPILIGQEDAMAVAESSGVSFIAMPFTMIISREGQFLGAFLGELHREQLDDIDNILGRLDAGSITVDEAKGAFKLL